MGVRVVGMQHQVAAGQRAGLFPLMEIAGATEVGRLDVVANTQRINLPPLLVMDNPVDIPPRVVGRVRGRRPASSRAAVPLRLQSTPTSRSWTTPHSARLTRCKTIGAGAKRISPIGWAMAGVWSIDKLKKSATHSMRTAFAIFLSASPVPFCWASPIRHRMPTCCRPLTG